MLESWLPMDSEPRKKSNCNARAYREKPNPAAQEATLEQDTWENIPQGRRNTVGLSTLFARASG
jgi:hypothetical protein